MECGKQKTKTRIFALTPRSDPSAYMVVVEMHYAANNELSELRNIMKNTTIALVPSPQPTRTAAANPVSSGCKDAGHQPNSNYLDDSDARGGSDAATLFTDDTSTITAQAPGFWNCDGSPDKVKPPNDGSLPGGIQPVAALRILQDSQGWTGIMVEASKEFSKVYDVDSILASYASLYRGCKSAGTVPYSSSLFTGKYGVFVNCGSAEKMAYLYALTPKKDPTAYMVLVLMQFASADDLSNLDSILKNTTINLETD